MLLQCLTSLDIKEKKYPHVTILSFMKLCFRVEIMDGMVACKRDTIKKLIREKYCCFM